MLKQMKFHEDARLNLAEGIKVLCKLLEDTYGPFGQNILLERSDGNLLVTGSSAAIVQDFAVKNLFYNEGVQMAREAIMHMSDIVGDGTTLTAILLHSLVHEGEKYLSAGMNPVFLRKGLIQAVSLVRDELMGNARMIINHKELKGIIETASKSLHIAELVSEAVEFAGNDGVILIKESKYESESRLEVVSGMQWNRGYLSQEFCKMNEQNLIFKDAYVFISEDKITEFSTLLPLLEQIMEKKVPLLIIAEEVSGEALTMLLHNVKKGIFEAAVIGIDGIGQRKKDNLEDLAVFLGGNPLRNFEKPIEFELEKLGRAKEIRMNAAQTVFLEGYHDKMLLEERCTRIGKKMERKDMNEYDREKHRERIGRLKEKIAVLHAGAMTSAEKLEEKRKLESAVRVARSAAQYGVTTGGGSALIHMASMMRRKFEEQDDHCEEEILGMKMLCHALYQPLRILCKNAGIDGSRALEQVRGADFGMGFDVRQERMRDMEQAGILDPVQVLCIAMEQAASMAGEWLTTAATMVSTAPDREDAELAKQGVPILR